MLQEDLAVPVIGAVEDETRVDVYVYAQQTTHRDIAVRFLTGDTHPDHDTIAPFRRENFDVVADCFVQVVELAKELNLLKVGTVSVDGTKMRANASKNRNVRYDRAGELLETLRRDVQELMEKAERTDQLDEQKWTP